MDEPFHQFSKLPKEIQSFVLSGSKEDVRRARELSPELRQRSLYQKIEQDILNIPALRELKEYLNTHPPYVAIGYHNYENNIGVVQVNYYANIPSKEGYGVDSDFTYEPAGIFQMEEEVIEDEKIDADSIYTIDELIRKG